jgi:hypothetical protein
VPKKQNKKTPGRSFGGRKRHGSGKATVPPVPSLPPIPEIFSSTLTPKVLGKLVQKMRSRSDGSASKDKSTKSLQSEGDSFTGAQAPSTRSKPLLKSKISNPKIQLPFTSVAPQSLTPTDSQVIANDETPQDPRSHLSTLSDISTASSPICSPATAVYRLAKPRLSPMEYMRLYFIESAHSARAKRPCELPKPTMTWHWASRWEKFLIIPHIPPSIKQKLLRNSPQGEDQSSCVKNSHPFKLVTESMTPFPQQALSSVCPRLSLNLGLMAPSLLPSLDEISISERSTCNKANESHVVVSNHFPRLDTNDQVTTSNGRIEIFHPSILKMDSQFRNRKGDDMSKELESEHHHILKIGPPQNPTSEGSETASYKNLLVEPQLSKNFKVVRSPTSLEVHQEAILSGASAFSSPVGDDLMETSSIYSRGSVDNPRSTEGNKGTATCSQSTGRPSIFDHKETTGGLIPNNARTPVRFRVATNYSPASLTLLSEATSHFNLPLAGNSSPTSITIDHRPPGKLLKTSSTWTTPRKDDTFQDLQPAPLRLARKPSHLEYSGIKPPLHGPGATALPSPTSKHIERLGRSPGVEESLDALITKLDRSMTVDSLGTIASGDALLADDPIFSHGIFEASGFTPKRRKSPEILSIRPDSPTLPPFLRSSLDCSEEPPPPSFKLPKRAQLSEHVTGVEQSLTSADETATTYPPPVKAASPPQGASPTQHGTNSHMPFLDTSTSSTSLFALDGEKKKHAVTVLSNLSPRNTISAFSSTTEHGQAARVAGVSETPPSAEHQPRHKPISIEAYKFATQRFDPAGRNFARNIVPSSHQGKTRGGNREVSDMAPTRTTSLAFGNLFRKRTRSEHRSGSPGTPTTPQVHWRPFDDEKGLSKSSWARDGLDRVIDGNQKGVKSRSNSSSQNTSQKAKFGEDCRSESDMHESTSKRTAKLRKKVSVDILLGRRLTLNSSPSPPPLPPLPAKHSWEQAYPTQPRETEENKFKTKKPKGLKIETRKLRKANRDGSRSSRVSSGGSSRTGLLRAASREEDSS